MVLIVAFIQIVVSDQVSHLAGPLGSFPLDVVGSDCCIRIFAVIQLAHRLMQLFGHFQPAVKVSIINFVSDSPYKYTGVVSVLAHPAFQIFFPPVFEIICVVIVGFCLLPHVETFCIEKKSKLVAQVKHVCGRHIVCAPDGIDPHFLQCEKLAAEGCFVHGGAQ